MVIKTYINSQLLGNIPLIPLIKTILGITSLTSLTSCMRSKCLKSSKWNHSYVLEVFEAIIHFRYHYLSTYAKTVFVCINLLSDGSSHLLNLVLTSQLTPTFFYELLSLKNLVLKRLWRILLNFLFYVGLKE